MYRKVFLIILFYHCIYYSLIFRNQSEKLSLLDHLNFEGSCSLRIFRNKYNYIKRDTVILVIPGGSYKYIADHEGFPIMEKFFSYGYSGAILNYKVGHGCYPANYIQGLKSIEYLSKKFKNIVLMGFSAGAHLAGLLGTTNRTQIPSVICMVLCYPVISFVEKPHEESVKYFLGNNYQNQEMRKNFSIENRVNENTIPTFIWTTRSDNIVSPENTFIMDESLKKKDVFHFVKIFDKGGHGLGLADANNNTINKDVSRWTKMADAFIEARISDDYYRYV